MKALLHVRHAKLFMSINKFGHLQFLTYDLIVLNTVFQTG
jgi:hypothetical protein